MLRACIVRIFLKFNCNFPQIVLRISTSWEAADGCQMVESEYVAQIIGVEMSWWKLLTRMPRIRDLSWVVGSAWLNLYQTQQLSWQHMLVRLACIWHLSSVGKTCWLVGSNLRLQLITWWDTLTMLTHICYLKAGGQLLTRLVPIWQLGGMSITCRLQCS
jgi:hypothetical protein